MIKDIERVFQMTSRMNEIEFLPEWAMVEQTREGLSY